VDATVRLIEKTPFFNVDRSNAGDCCGVPVSRRICCGLALIVNLAATQALHRAARQSASGVNEKDRCLVSTGPCCCRMRQQF